MSDDVRILLAQHAKTTELLGVDFLPLGTPPSMPTGSPTFDKPAQIRPMPEAVAVQSPPDFQTNEPQIQPVSCRELQSGYEHLDDPQAQLDALRARYELDAPHQHFNTKFTNIVFGEGSPTAELMFVGEVPGEQEDLTGRPFVGRAGELLEKMIGAMGLSRQTVYIANVLKTRPPNNATPTHQESLLCAPYLMEQIRIIAPKVIVTLGLPASHLLLGSRSPMRSLRGHWHAFPPTDTSIAMFSGDDGNPLPKIELMPTYHPAYLLRSYTPENRRKVWADLTMVMEKLGLEPR
jgi:uracil-DNA glycosylase